MVKLDFKDIVGNIAIVEENKRKNRRNKDELKRKNKKYEYFPEDDFSYAIIKSADGQSITRVFDNRDSLVLFLMEMGYTASFSYGLLRTVSSGLGSRTFHEQDDDSYYTIKQVEKYEDKFSEHASLELTVWELDFGILKTDNNNSYRFFMDENWTIYREHVESGKFSIIVMYDNLSTYILGKKYKIEDLFEKHRGKEVKRKTINEIKEIK